MKVTVENKKLVSESAKRTLSPMQKEYRKFIKARLKERGVKSPFEGGPDAIIDFFAGVSEEWANHKASLSSESASSEFEGSDDASEFMYNINHMMNDKRLKAWTKDTDSNYGVKSAAALKAAQKAYSTFIDIMDTAGE